MRVQDAEGIPPDQQGVIYARMELKDRRTPRDCNLKHAAIVRLVLKLRGTKPAIYLLAPNLLPNLTVMVNMDANWTFSTIYPIPPAAIKVAEESSSMHWLVTTHEDGTITDRGTGVTCSYLFWDATSGNFNCGGQVGQGVQSVDVFHVFITPERSATIASNSFFRSSTRPLRP
jgi:hypothetical protein